MPTEERYKKKVKKERWKREEDRVYKEMRKVRMSFIKEKYMKEKKEEEI